MTGAASGHRLVRRANKTEATAFGGAAEKLWEKYVGDVTSRAESVTPGYQKFCAPELHLNRGIYQGTIMMFHGYTACPQQFDRLIPLLTARGYTVLVPTLPGFGYKYKTVKGKIEDYIEDMPEDPSLYREFGDRMVAIMKAVGRGKKLIFGHSLGATVASYVNYHLGSTVTRALIACPMIEVAGILDLVLRALQATTVLKELRAGWGEPCEVERGLGRAGVCQFRANHGIAGRNFGSSHRDEVKIPARRGTMQMLFVEDDGAVSAPAVRDLGLHYGFDSTSPYICGFDAALGHSFLSPYDNPTQEKYWLDEVTLKVADFLTKGMTFKQSGSIDGYPRCDLQSQPSR